MHIVKLPDLNPQAFSNDAAANTGMPLDEQPPVKV
jgi:hypothetical protein